MENRFTQRMSRMFRSSFGSCRSRNISDVIQTQQGFQMIDPPSPKLRPFPSIFRPKCSETFTINDTCCLHSTPPRRKVSEQRSPFAFAGSSGCKCPPVSQIHSLDSTYYECKEKKEDRSVKNKKKKRTHLRKTKTRVNNAFVFSSSSQESFKAWSWFSSDDEKEDETETLFSSKSLTSDSSDLSLCRHSSRRNKDRTRRRSRSSRKSGSDVLPLSGGGKNNNNNNKTRVKDSFAVVKSSSDPYNDFRTSMVEMIVEKQIFAAEDLEQLLQCFLSLNSDHHHRIIIEVFMEIWEALFSNWS